MNPRWVTAFLDLAPGTAGRAQQAEAFWAAATGSVLSARRGGREEFATLLPPDGDAFLRVQRLESGDDGVHLDLHVEDVRAAADRAVTLGAVQVADPGHVVLRSPTGLLFCCVPVGSSAVRPRPVTWPSGHVSVVDQVCLDIPAAAYDVEVGFWAALTGWEQRATDLPEFGYLVKPNGQPIRLLLQRLGVDDTGSTARAHLDLSTTDRPAEVARLLGLGARHVRDGDSWSVLADPAGRVFCVTDRRP